MQQAICSIACALAPSTQAASVDVITAATTSSEASARLQRIIVSIVCRAAEPCQLDAHDFTLDALTLSATYYFDEATRFGLSITHDNGKSPPGSFVGHRREVLALTIKFSPE